MDDKEITDTLQRLEKLLKLEFKDKQLLLSAITHRSYLNEHREATWEHNERLEFLGDAVLELVVTDYLYRTYPEKPEGELTAVRASLVNTVSLSNTSDIMGVNPFLLMSKGEAKDEGRARQYILANVFEALVGAMYLDQGYDVARDFIADKLFDRTDEIITKRLWQDPKSRFQELAQEQVSVTPTYKMLSQTGPDHDRIFTIGVYLKNEEIATGHGRSKQEAEQEAAQKAITAKGWE